MSHFKTAIIQFTPSFGDVAKTIAALQLLLQKASEADLVVLPELANSGYNFKDFEEAFQLSEIPEKSVFTNFLIAQCKKYSFSIVTGFNERSGNKIYNAALLITEDGIAGKYRKIQLFMNEKDYFTPGDARPELYDVKGIKIGILICFDWLFPELWTGLAAKGVDIICHPSNLVLPGNAQKAIPVWAMINRIYIATANRTGTEGSLTFTGGSLIASPAGEVLVSASADHEEVLIASCDTELSGNKMITPKNHIFTDRRPELYF